MPDSTYSDLNPYTPTQHTLDLDVNAIYNSLENIISTERKERLFNLDVTGGLEELLFEPLSPRVASSILDSIDNAVTRFEPRVNISYNRSEVAINDAFNGYDVFLVFTIRNLGSREFTHNFFLAADN